MSAPLAQTISEPFPETASTLPYDTAQGNNIKELRIATIGNVDAGKTTLTSVLVLGQPDNGRGSARNRIMKSKHEIDSGRTSTITNHFIRGQDPLKPDREVVVDFRDLAGHSRYFKTMVRGMCRPLDYAMLVVAANDGIMEMTKEHFTLSLNLKVPLFIVITKIDMAPDGALEATRKQIIGFLSPPIKSRKRKNQHGQKQKLLHREPVFLCESESDYEYKLGMIQKAYHDGDFHRYIPVFEVSSKPNLPTAPTHPESQSSKQLSTISQCQNIKKLLDYIMRLPVYQNYKYLVDKPAAYFVENEFNVKGVGLVLSGIVMTGQVKKGDKLKLGPFYDKFHTVTVRSIHNNFREEVLSLPTGCSGCIAIRIDSSANITRKMIRGGMRVVAPGAEECLYWRFRAKVLIQKHPTSITEGYEAFIHCGAANQVARIETIITEKENKILRLGDRAEVIFKFMKRPEYIQPGMRLVFRESQTKGVGEVITTLEDEDTDSDLAISSESPSQSRSISESDMAEAASSNT